MPSKIKSKDRIKVSSAASDLARCLELYHDWNEFRHLSTKGSDEDDFSAVQTGLLLYGRLSSAASSSVEILSVFQETSVNLEENAKRVLEANGTLFSEQMTSYLNNFAQQDRATVEQTLANLPTNLAAEQKNVTADVFQIQSGVGPPLTAAISKDFACNIAAGLVAGGLMTLNPYAIIGGVGFAIGLGC